MNQRDFQRVGRLLEQRVEQAREVPGAVLLVRYGDAVVFHEAYGWRQEVPCRRRMTRDTVFDLASLTKPLSTSLLALILAQGQEIDLDGGMGIWFPGIVKDRAKEGITLRDLLANRSGLPDWRPYYRDVAPEQCPLPLERLVDEILAEPLVARPRAREIYSDLGFVLAGSILERATGLALDRLFEERIARPLGLRVTGYRRVRPGAQARVGDDQDVAATAYCPWRKRILAGEVHDENCYLVGGVAGHAGLFGPAREIDRIVAEIFRGLEGESNLFSPGFLEAFFERQEGVPDGTWALGWDTPSEKGSTSGRYFSRRSIGHTGYTGTSLWMDLERRVAVVFLTNRVHPEPRNTAIRRLRPETHDAVLEAIGC